MKIEDQVCTLEQAIKLKELGVIYPEPQYAYINRLGEFQLNNVLEFNRWANDNKEDFVSDRTYYAAFTDAELGVMLPDMLTTHLQYELVSVKESDNEWLCRYCRANDLRDTLFDTSGNTEAQSRAEMLIKLLNIKGFVTIDEVNKLLQ